MPKQNVIMRMLETLGSTKVELAVMLGVSERAIRDWEELSDEAIRSSSTKARRAWRLSEVIDYLRDRHTDSATSSSLKSILNNGRIPMSDDPEEDMSLISYICAEPTATAWRANADAAYKDHADFIRSRELNRAAKLSDSPSVR